MKADDFFTPELRAAIENNAKVKGSTGAYARLQLGLLGHLRQAMADEIALGTQPNDAAIALGSIFGFVLIELVAVKTNNPAHIVGRAAAAFSEQTVNMMIAAAATAVAGAKR